MCIEVHRERRHEGFNFTGTHLGDLAFVQGHTNSITSKWRMPMIALASPTAYCEGFWPAADRGFRLAQTGFLELIRFGARSCSSERASICSAAH
jgi:hypothetical protein